MNKLRTKAGLAPDGVTLQQAKQRKLKTAFTLNQRKEISTLDFIHKNQTYPVVIKQKLDKIYATIVFTYWTTGSTGLWSLKKVNGLVEPYLLPGSLSEGIFHTGGSMGITHISQRHLLSCPF